MKTNQIKRSEVGIPGGINLNQMGIPGLKESDVIVGQPDHLTRTWFAMPCDDRLMRYYDTEKEAVTEAESMAAESRGRVIRKQKQTPNPKTK